VNLRVALFSVALTFALASLRGGEAFAQTVRTLSPEQAQGRGSELVTIPLSPGTGINISFLETNSTIEKAWLDNPSWLTLDSDGCLVSSASSSPARQSPGQSASSVRSSSSQVVCSGPAYVLHIRGINELKIPGLPSGTETTLSVITRDQQDGTRQISVFRLVRGHSTFRTVEVVSNLAPSPQQPIFVDLGLLRRGRQAAVDSNFLRVGDPLDSKISNFINFLSNGTPSDLAMTRSGISQPLVTKLLELGRSAPLPPVDSKREASPL
jgi:hypothetical protein